MCALINVALSGFRESDAPDYDPSFEVPLYPWTPIFGTLTGFALLTQMGLIAIVGAVGIVIARVVWYRATSDRESPERARSRIRPRSIGDARSTGPRRRSMRQQRPPSLSHSPRALRSRRSHTA